MKKIISEIHNAIQNSRTTVEFLMQNSKRTWVENYPVALIHEINRIKDSATLQALQEIDFFSAEGFSKESYTKKEMQYISQNIPNAIKTAYLICMKEKQTNDYIFKEKFSHDKWKKVQDNQNFEAFVASSKFLDTSTNKDIESHLRDIMRSAKEIPSLKATGFVWIVSVPQTSKIENILEHYFLNNHIYVQRGRKVTYIAWSEKLANINMRYFVNTP